MKKVAITYGFIAGTIVSTMMFVTMSLYKGGVDLQNGEIIGYSTMIIALAMVFFGIKSYRDNYSGGVISFLKGAQVGLLITLFASMMYALSWEVVYSRTGEEFTKKTTERHFENLKKEGISEIKMEEEKKKWSSFSEMYKNPIIRFGVTLLEIAPVGIVITLISAAILRRKEFLSSDTNISLN